MLSFAAGGVRACAVSICYYLIMYTVADAAAHECVCANTLLKKYFKIKRARRRDANFAHTHTSALGVVVRRRIACRGRRVCVCSG